MPEFIARIGSSDGTVTERTFTAESESALRDDLRGREFHVFNVRKKSGLASLLPDFRGRRSIRMKEFLLFNQEMAALIRAGLPIIASLEILLERRKSPVFRKALSDIRDRVRGGASLSEAFESQGGLFPPLYSSTLASGERSGEVASVLQRYIGYQKMMLDLGRRVATALIYPVCLMLLSIVVVTVMIVFVVPKFQGLFEEAGADLPILTRLVIGFSGAVTNHWEIILVGLVVTALGLRTWVSTPAGRRMVDRISLRLPILGGLFLRFTVTRFVRTLSTLLSGGIPVVTALGISARAVGNSEFEEQLVRVERKVREGGSLWQALDETGKFNDIAIEMTRVGESTGSLHEMLQNVSEFYDEEINSRLNTIMALMEPAILVIMGVLVAILMLSIYMPLVQMYGMGS